MLECELLGKSVAEFDLNVTKEWKEETLIEPFPSIMVYVKCL